MTPDPSSISRSELAIPQSALDDLARRLARTRLPDELPGAGSEYGVPLAQMRELLSHWRERYDWRAQEAELNRWPQYFTTVDGQLVHFLHVRSPHEGALPLILTHGWPGSVLEFTPIIGALTDPAAHGGEAADAFHVVIPSIPGFGLSGPTTARGWGPTRVASAWSALMERLGYGRYGAQGGDFGSTISTALGRLDPDHVAGVHLNLLFTPLHGDPATFPDEERVAHERQSRFSRELSGYFRVQATRPQTLSFALNDSPVGLLAWIAERFTEWTAPDFVVDPDVLLSNVMLYWLTSTVGSSMRMYWELAREPRPASLERSPTPIGVALFPHELAVPVRSVAERSHNIVHWSPQAAGGHFAALEQPELFVADVRRFFRLVR
jgi:pimeloyl-ACP methyl ester carboxylesterase